MPKKKRVLKKYKFKIYETYSKNLTLDELGYRIEVKTALMPLLPTAISGNSDHINCTYYSPN